jgi:hypothetical protein
MTDKTMTDKKLSLPLASLVEDMSVYPRHTVDDVHVNKLVKALEAGETLPAPVVDQASKRIADGWHRIRAHRRVLGPEGVIDVLLRPYANEKEFLLDAIAMNATHGRSLDKIDYIRCVVLAQSMGIDDIRIAVALHQPEREVRKLSVRIATVPTGSPDMIPGTTTIALKRPVRHLAETLLTKEQAVAHPSVPGTSYLLLTHQLRDAVRFELANRQDEVLQQALCELRDELIRYCA